MPRKLSLSAISDVAMIVVAIVVVSSAVLQWAQPKPTVASASPRADRPAPARSFQPGERAPVDERIDYATSDQVLLMFLRSSCRYCTASMPFYQKLVAVRPPNGPRTQLIAFAPEPESSFAHYLGEHQLTLDGAYSVGRQDFSAYRVDGTPTLVLINRDRVIQKVWVGQLDEAEQGEVLHWVSGGAVRSAR